MTTGSTRPLAVTAPVAAHDAASSRSRRKNRRHSQDRREGRGSARERAPNVSRQNARPADPPCSLNPPFMRMRTWLEETMSRHTGQDVAKVNKDIDRDKILSAQEALEYGIVDQVLTSRKRVPAALTA